MTESIQEDTVNKIFKHWKSAMGKMANTQLTKKRKKVIIDRLNDGYSIDDIFDAVDNCSRSSWHMGSNDRRTKYNDIELICRTGEKLEHFRDNLQVKFVASVSSTTDKNIETLKAWKPPQ